MNLVNLCILYVLVGIACAVAIHIRLGRRQWVHAALAIPLWPLWAPVVLAEAPAPTGETSDLPTRIEGALREGVEAASGSPLQAMLNADSAARISRMAGSAAARLAELSQLLRRPDFCLQRAHQRVADAEQAGSARSLATARLHLQNLERLQHMAQRDQQVLQELAELAEGLRTQLLMTRFAGASAQGIGDIIGDLWSRVEALSEAADDHRIMEAGDGIAAHTGGR